MRVLLLSTTPAFGQSVLRCLGQAGVLSHVWCSTRFSPMRLSRYCRRYRYVPEATLLDPSPTAAARMDRVCARQKLEAVLATDMPTAYALAALQPHLHTPAFPLPDADTLQLLDDKWRFAEFLDQQGVPQPATRLIRKLDDLDDLDLLGPLIVKPPLGEGGQGVARVANSQALVADLRCGAHPLPLLVQEFVPGHDVDMSLLALRGGLAAYTIQEATGEPDTRRFLEDPEIVAAGRRIVEGSSFHGVMHLDMRRDARDGSLRVIECNPRFWGSIELSLWAGVNFPALGLERVPEFGAGPLRARNLGICQATGLAPRRLVKALLSGHVAPPELTPASRKAWFQYLADPLPELVARIRRSFESG